MEVRPLEGERRRDNLFRWKRKDRLELGSDDAVRLLPVDRSFPLDRVS